MKAWSQPCSASHFPKLVWFGLGFALDFGLAWSGLAWLGLAGFSFVWLGLVWLGLAWFWLGFSNRTQKLNKNRTQKLKQIELGGFKNRTQKLFEHLQKLF